MQGNHSLEWPDCIVVRRGNWLEDSFPVNLKLV